MKLLPTKLLTKLMKIRTKLLKLLLNIPVRDNHDILEFFHAEKIQIQNKYPIPPITVDLFNLGPIFIPLRGTKNVIGGVGYNPNNSEPNNRKISNKNNPNKISNKNNPTSFPDGTIHCISMKSSVKIEDFIITPYIEDDYRVTVFYDKLNLKEYNDLNLSHDASRSLITDNAGGNSDYSEAISMHYFEHVFEGSEFILENEVEYWKEYKMVDFICSIKDQRVGISVTRAMSFPDSYTFDRDDGVELIHRKLSGLIVACDLVIKKHSFTKSILHIWCQNQRIADIMKDVYEQELEIDSLGLKVLCDVIVIITVCNDRDLYTNRDEEKDKIMIMNE